MFFFFCFFSLMTYSYVHTFNNVKTFISAIQEIIHNLNILINYYRQCGDKATYRTKKYCLVSLKPIAYIRHFIFNNHIILFL